MRELRNGLTAACGVAGIRLSHRQSKARRARDRTMIQPWRTDGPALTVRLSRPECNHLGRFGAPEVSNSVRQSLVSGRHGRRRHRHLHHVAVSIRRLFARGAGPVRHNTVLSAVRTRHISSLEHANEPARTTASTGNRRRRTGQQGPHGRIVRPDQITRARRAKARFAKLREAEATEVNAAMFVNLKTVRSRCFAMTLCRMSGLISIRYRVASNSRLPSSLPHHAVPPIDLTAGYRR